MQFNELFDTLQNLIKIKPTVKNIAGILEVSEKALYARKDRGSEFSLKELFLIESFYGLQHGILAGCTQSTQVPDDCVKLDYIHIAPSCGKGTVVLDEADVTPIRIGKEIIKDIWKVSSPDVLKLFKESGDSMENTIEDGNILLVDTSRTDYHNGGIYVLTINNDWFVKRLRLKINGDLEIISDNPKYEPEVLKPNTDIEINVVGRVIKNLTRGL